MSTGTPDTFEGGSALTGEAGRAGTKVLLELMDKGYWPFRIAARSLSADVIETPTSSGWTYKEMLAHVAAWHELAARRLRAYREHGVIDPADLPDEAKQLDGLGLSDESRARLQKAWDADALNAAVREAAAARPAAEVLADLDKSRQALRAEVEKLSDAQARADVDEGRSFAYAHLEGNTFGHYREHEDELRAGLPKSAAELAERIDRDWQRFRDEIRHLGRAGLEQTAHEKWTYKDLLAHVVGWLEDVPRRIEAMRAGTHREIASHREIDEFNARSVSSHALVGAEAMLDELDTSYRRMREAVRGLGDEEVRSPQILGLVATRTYLHWEMHEPELRR